MNNLAAYQSTDGAWHFGIVTRLGTFPIGYCANETVVHPDEASARTCYSNYRKAHIQLNATTFPWTGCAQPGCPNPSQLGAAVAGDTVNVVALCTTHMTLDIATQLLGCNSPATDQWLD